MNLRQPWTAIPLAAAAVLLASVGACQRSNVDRTETVGPFEIVTHWTLHKSGDTVTEHFSVRWRGEEFAFVGAAGLSGARGRTYRTVNAVITFPTPRPAFVVNVGDPATGSFFYLVREVGGEAKAEPLGAGIGDVSADWVDPPPGDTVTERDPAVRRRHMTGGTLLLLGDWTVLDTRTLRSYALRPRGALPVSFALPSSLSPDRRSFARPALGPEHEPLLLVHAYAAGVSYVLPIDRRAMRFNDLKEIDRGWVDHHFQWRSVDGGPERLVPREGVAPLPYRVRRAEEDLGPTFMIFSVKAEMKDTLIAFLAREMDAIPMDTVPAEPGWSPPTPLRMGEVTVYVKLLPEASEGEFRLAVWAHGARPTRIAERIADRFDAELKTGRLDALFDP